MMHFQFRTHAQMVTLNEGVRTPELLSSQRYHCPLVLSARFRTFTVVHELCLNVLPLIGIELLVILTMLTPIGTTFGILFLHVSTFPCLLQSFSRISPFSAAATLRTHISDNAILTIVVVIQVQYYIYSRVSCYIRLIPLFKLTF